MQVGRRLAIKLLNASKFVLGKATPVGAVTHPLDRGMLTRLAHLVGAATASLDAYDYTAALREIETFFWWFCDDHIEHVKRRRATDSESAASATASCLTALVCHAAPVRAVRAVRDRGSLVVVADGIGASRAMADAR